MIGHVLTLSLYLASTLMYYIAFYYINANPNNKKLSVIGLTIWDVCTVINLLSQLVLCALFWNLGTVRAEKQMELPLEVQVTDEEV